MRACSQLETLACLAPLLVWVRLSGGMCDAGNTTGAHHETRSPLHRYCMLPRGLRLDVRHAASSAFGIVGSQRPAACVVQRFGGGHWHVEYRRATNFCVLGAAFARTGTTSTGVSVVLPGGKSADVSSSGTAGALLIKNEGQTATYLDTGLFHLCMLYAQGLITEQQDRADLIKALLTASGEVAKSATQFATVPALQPPTPDAPAPKAKAPSTPADAASAPAAAASAPLAAADSGVATENAKFQLNIAKRERLTAEESRRAAADQRAKQNASRQAQSARPNAASPPASGASAPK